MDWAAEVPGLEIREWGFANADALALLPFRIPTP